MLFAKEGILIFATEEYIDAVWYIAPLTLSVLFSFLYGIIGNIMFYYEKTWQMSAITIFCAVINIVTNYFGIKMFGPVAAGYTTLLCSIIQVTTYYFVVRRYEKHLTKIIDLRFVALIVAVYIGFMIYATAFYNYFWLRAGLIALVGVAVLILHKKIIALFKSMKSKEDTVAQT